MWSFSVVLGISIFYSRVFGGEIPDVTTIYEIGSHVGLTISDGEVADVEPLDVFTPPPCKGVAGRVHARTNALGMAIINEEMQYIEPENTEFPNTTCDVNFGYDQSCTQWDLKNDIEWISSNDTRAGIPLKCDGRAHKMMNKEIVIKLRKQEGTSYLMFTEAENSDIINFFTRLEVVIPGTINIYTYFSCVKNLDCQYNYCYKVYDHSSGTFTTISCNSYESHNTVDLEDQLKFQFDSGRIKIFQSNGKIETNIFDYNYQYHQGPLDINYFSAASENLEETSITALPKGIQISDEGIASPIFTPTSRNICLAIFCHSSKIHSNSQLKISVVGPLPNGKYPYFHFELKEGWNIGYVNVTLNNLDPIFIIIEKTGAAAVHIARAASCNPEGEDVIELSSQPFDCTKDQWNIRQEFTAKSSFYTTFPDIFGGVEITKNTTSSCWNGGVLTSGGCACTPGFSGSTCEVGCGRNRYGHDCEGLCSFHSGKCKGLLMCTKYTGCQCAPGYRGDYCTQVCKPGWYGNDCAQRCGNCAGNLPCDIYTGQCTACKGGYLAPLCKTASVYYGSKPELTTPSYGTIVVSFDPNNYITRSEPPQLYQIQIKEEGGEWTTHTTKSLQKNNIENEKDRKVSEEIVGLRSGIVYQVRVLFIDGYFQKYDDDLVQVAEILTKCDIPDSYDYKLTAVSNETAVSVSWRYTIEDEHWCPLDTFEATWTEGWRRLHKLTSNNIFTLDNLEPGLPIKFKVRAKTTGGFAPYSKTLTVSTALVEQPPVRNLQAESSESTSVEVSWEPPRGSENTKLRYTVSYKCVDRPACSPGCQNVSEGQLTQEATSITLSPLLPFTQYLVTVSAEGGAESSIYVGTTKTVPTEIPVLSAQKPVRTNTSVTVFWDIGPVCTGYLLGFNYQLTKASDIYKILASGFTKDKNVSFHNLTASTEYVVQVFALTVAGWNPKAYLDININTSATVPEPVRNLTVYKRGRGMLGLRWAEPRATYGQLKSFTVSHSLGQDVTSHTVEPTRCVAWPELYCHTIEGLRSNRRYNVSVSARNSEVAEDGEVVYISAITKESPPSAPVNLKVSNISTTTIELEWDYPEMANGIVRSFLIGVEETEKYDQDTCCQIYPFVETLVKEESKTYRAEVSGLHPASTYFVSVSAKTVGLGPSQSLVVSTRPPHLRITSLPRILPRMWQPDVSWLPQDALPEVNNSDIYTSLIRAHLLLAVFNDNQSVQLASESGLTDPKLESLLRQRIKAPFYFITEYNQDDDVVLDETPEDSPWGRPPALSGNVTFQLVAVQVSEYNSIYNVDLCFSNSLTV